MKFLFNSQYFLLYVPRDQRGSQENSPCNLHRNWRFLCKLKITILDLPWNSMMKLEIGVTRVIEIFLLYKNHFCRFLTSPSKLRQKWLLKKREKKFKKIFSIFFKKCLLTFLKFCQINSEDEKCQLADILEYKNRGYSDLPQNWLGGQKSPYEKWDFFKIDTFHFLIVQFLRSPIKFVEFSRKVTRYDALSNFSRDCLTQLAPRGQMGGFKKSIEKFSICL